MKHEFLAILLIFCIATTSCDDSVSIKVTSDYNRLFGHWTFVRSEGGGPVVRTASPPYEFSSRIIFSADTVFSEYNNNRLFVTGKYRITPASGLGSWPTLTVYSLSDPSLADFAYSIVAWDTLVLQPLDVTDLGQSTYAKELR